MDPGFNLLHLDAIGRDAIHRSVWRRSDNRWNRQCIDERRQLAYVERGPRQTLPDRSGAQLHRKACSRTQGTVLQKRSTCYRHRLAPAAAIALEFYSVTNEN